MNTKISKLALSLRLVPFVAMHLACLGVFFVPFAWQWLLLGIGLYTLRMFGITAGYHRYFAHKSFKTTRVFQFVLAWLGLMAAQKGPLWWAAHHRIHHRYSGSKSDVHAPEKKGFWWSHVGWIFDSQNDVTHFDKIKDFAIYPELRFLNRFFLLPPLVLALAIFFLWGWSALFWGFFVSTFFLYHGTFFINSLCHMFGKRRFAVTDDSRNSLILALITMGEGWHNNHHFYQTSTRQGLYWWEIDFSYYILKTLSFLGLVWDIKIHPKWVYEKVKENKGIDLSYLTTLTQLQTSKT